MFRQRPELYPSGIPELVSLDFLPRLKPGIPFHAVRAYWGGSCFIDPTSTKGGAVSRQVVAACPSAIFLAAFTSALAVCPQDRQRKPAWLSRFSVAVCPHGLHRCDV